MSSPAFVIPKNQKQARDEAIAQIRHTLSVMFDAGDTVELRIPGIQGKRTDSGYFNDFDALSSAAAAYEGRADGIYITVNPLNPALLARSVNRVKEYAKQTSADKDVLRRRWLFIDFDPVRPAGISSSEEEHQAAIERAKACRDWLATRSIHAILADSGNGAHLLIPINWSNDEATAALIKQFLMLLDSMFSNEQVKVDTGMVGASHLIKLYGTVARKGDSTAHRPHRRSMLLEVPDAREPVSVDSIEQLLPPVKEETLPSAKRAPASEHVPSAGRTSLDDIKAQFDMVAYAERHFGVQAVQSGKEYRLPGNGGLLINLDKRMWYHHTGQAGGDAIDLVGYCRFGTGWNKHDTGLFKQVLQEAAAFAGIVFPAAQSLQSNTQHSHETPPLRLVKAPLPEGDRPPPLDIRQAALTPSPTLSNPPVSNMLMHVDDLDDLPPIRWLIQDYIPEDSLIEVYGAPSAGKTQVVFDMAQTLAASGKTVIYVVAEGLRGYRSRKKAWQKFRKQDGGELYIWREPVQLFDIQAVKEFISTIQSKQPALVVFDTLSRCSLGADENNQKDMGIILESLDRVRRDTGATVVAVHHTNAAGARERGSTVIRGGMTVMLEVSKEDDLIAVSCAKVKDSAEFDTLYLKPVLVDIGEELPVPVLVPAEKRVQTREDKLSSMQLEILRSVGMEMFAESGIKSSQLDELLPPGTKRSSKYHSLNALIRLGYVSPHEKGDPYVITEAGRLKLSNAESAAVSVKSNMSKASPNPFIWTLPEACPMYSPVPHTSGCGTDKTLDTRATDEKTDEQNTATAHVNTTAAIKSNVQTAPNVQDSKVDDIELPPMTAQDIARYAQQVDVHYPTTDGAALYKIAEIVPRHLRAAFEIALGEAFMPYFEEVLRREQDPPEKEVRDVLALYLTMGFISADVLYDGYKHACELGHKMPFLTALNSRNPKAISLLKEMIAGQKVREMIVIQAIPKYPNGDGGKG